MKAAAWRQKITASCPYDLGHTVVPEPALNLELLITKCNFSTWHFFYLPILDCFLSLYSLPYQLN